MDENKIKMKHFRGDAATRMGLGSEPLMVVKLPDPKILRVVSRSVFLALVFVTFPFLGSLSKALTAGPSENPRFGFDFDRFDSLLRGLAEEGLLRQNDRVLILCPGIKTASRGLRSSVAAMDSSSGPTLLGERFDLVYAEDLARDPGLVDRLVKKPGGIVAFPLSDEYAGTVKGRTGYKIVYLRRYSSTIVAMRNVENGEEKEEAKPSTTRRLLQSPPKAEALKDLEEALLEPPRQQRRRRGYSRRIKFLPELLGDDSLGGFGRRVFVNVGLAEQNRDATEWFDRNYPKMRQEFEVHDVEGGVVVVSEWLTRNVREEEYVVMKAEAEVVEEMVSDGTIHLVDELFLECNNEWWRVGNTKKNKSESNRAYWECLALYGTVKDEGVAVHQWWG